MSDADIELLAGKVDELQLELHAAKVAITILSSCVTSLTGDRDVLVNSVKEGWPSHGKIEFEFSAEPGYEEKLKEKVLQLL
ncbi:hypothetical protein [Pantoea agglomerans]|uniref:hypothetical protein n=1 Tax=Enterobacter agglomerans TaxID=549 RepID=UPI0013BD26D1|nr:hypothetical protein [Pantoea agglomerans]NEG57976.1 hypothetical protein [Pantoea agglomerans]NEG99690.1 hypothetical protein [Pantoea agglomerans]NEH04348.1 hypothetical protein [Pantoea agglomerans]NEH14249.1 hypothetical protein [Pantoea agglomerans]